MLHIHRSDANKVFPFYSYYIIIILSVNNNITRKTVKIIIFLRYSNKEAKKSFEIIQFTQKVFHNLVKSLTFSVVVLFLYQSC